MIFNFVARQFFKWTLMPGLEQTMGLFRDEQQWWVTSIGLVFYHWAFVCYETDQHQWSNKINWSKRWWKFWFLWVVLLFFWFQKIKKEWFILAPLFEKNFLFSFLFYIKINFILFSGKNFFFPSLFFSHFLSFFFFFLATKSNFLPWHQDMPYHKVF